MSGADKPKLAPCNNTRIPIADLNFSNPIKSTTIDGVNANIPPAPTPVAIEKIIKCQNFSHNGDKAKQMLVIHKDNITTV